MPTRHSIIGGLAARFPGKFKRWPAFLAGAILGGAATLAVSATGQRPVAPTPQTLRPVTVTLHRFDIVLGQER